MTTILCLAAAWVCNSKDNTRLLKGSPNSVGNARLLAVGLTLFLGLRPIHYVFGDMVIYRRGFRAKYLEGTADSLGKASEPLWQSLCDFAHYMMPSASLDDQFTFFCFLVSAGYILFMCRACVRLHRRHSYLLLLFLVANFQFYAYCVNGMRNGLACSMVLLAITYMTPQTADRIKAGVLCLCAYLIHNSTIVPIMALWGAYYVMRDTRKCIYVWFGAVLVSLVAGQFVENFFVALGFDDRVQGYVRNQSFTIHSEFGAGAQVNYGFRWDFLLYSFAPIWLGWYVIYKRKITDSRYTLLLNTYILANSVWVMLIRALFSNRFAYLSWFMFGVVIAYPLFKFGIYRRQGVVAAAFIVGSMIFTWMFG